MSAFDELQRQLVASVTARGGRGRSRVPGGSWRKRGRRRLGAVLTTIPLLLVAAAGSAMLVARTGANTWQPPPAAVSTAGGFEGPCRPCRASDGRLHAPLSEESTAGGVVSGRDTNRRSARRAAPAAVRWTSSQELPPLAETPTVG